MRKILLTLAIATTSVFTINAQSIFGKWKSFDSKGKLNSIVEVYEKDGKAYAKILNLTDPAEKDAVCDKCKDHRKNQPIAGMEILSGLKKDDDEWNGGEILDPETGKIYGCYIKLVEKNKLKVKGHLKGFSFIGKTVYWIRN